MTKTEIRLDRMSDVNRFVEVMSRLDDQVWLEDGHGCRISAKSLLGVLYSLEWSKIYCYCERDINVHLLPWIV
jgi:hypothetical protein